MQVKNQKSKVKNKYRFLLTFSLFALFAPYLFSQQKNLSLNREWSLKPERCFIKYDSLSLSTFKPIIESQEATMDKYCFYNNYVRESPHRITHKLLRRKLTDENLIIIYDSTDNFNLTIDPLFNFEFGRDLASTDTTPEKLYKNTRGVLVRGDIGTKFSFESSFQENQATYVKYMDDYIQSTDTAFINTSYYPYHVIPGQGRSKVFKKNGYDFGFSSGYISYSPGGHFNFQIGTGKHFVGDGYRSLLLSDNAFNYPFARITTSFGKIQYTNLYASFMNLTDGGVKIPSGTERLLQKKAGSFQFLSWNIHKRIQLGLFQGMIWKSADSSNKMNLHISYANPIIYWNALQYGLNNENNILLGTTLKSKITNSISFYGQYMLDDIADDFIKGSIHNKQGFQIGAKYFDLFGAKNLHLQLEYNQVRPYSYASRNSSQSYTHYNQPLAHPLGAWFKESIVFLNYRLRDFFTEIRFSYARVGSHNFNYNSGENVFLSDSSNLPGVIPSGNITPLLHSDFHIGYLINPSTNLNIVVGISNRTKKYIGSIPQTNFVYFGIRTSLGNVYYDF